MRICLGVAVTVKNPLGDITLSLNETAIIPLTQAFFGFILDYSLEDTDPEHVSIMNTGRCVLTSVTPIEPRYRKAGPVFFLNENNHFVLYSVSTLELWRGEEQTVTKVWEIPISYSIAGIDSIKDDWRLGLVYWTLSTLESAFFFVDLAKPPTSVEILRIPTYPNMKVSICEYKPLIILSWINETKHYIAYYSLAINSTQATLAHLYADFSLEILQSICVDKAYFLTSEGLYQNSYPSFFSNEKIQRFLPTKQNITSITKMRWGTFSVQTENELIFYSDHEGVIKTLPNSVIGPDLQIMKVEYNYLKAFYSAKDGIYSSIKVSTTSNLSRLVNIPGLSGSTILDISQEWSSEIDLFAFIREDAVSVYSVSYGEVVLQVKSALHPYALSLCAFEHFNSQNRECQFSTVRTLPLIEDQIMYKDGFNLTNYPIHPVLIELPIDQAYRCMWDISTLFSGSNLQYGVTLQEVPKFLNMTLYLEQPYLTKPLLSFPEFLNQSIFCADFTSSVSTILSGRENSILIISILDTPTQTLIKLQENEHLVACSLDHFDHIMFIVEDNLKVRSLYVSEQMQKVSDIGRVEECRIVGRMGICRSEEEVVGVNFNTLETVIIRKAGNDRFLSIWTSEESIIILSTGKVEFGQFNSDGFLRLGTSSVPNTATRAIGTSKHLVVHHSDGYLAAYRILFDYHIVLTNYYRLDKCTFQDFDISLEVLVVMCVEYTQVIYLPSFKYSAKVFTLPSAPTYMQLDHLNPNVMHLNQVVCSSTDCLLVKVTSFFLPEVIITINAKVIDPQLFGAARNTTMIGEIEAYNEKATKQVIPLRLTIRHFGMYATLTDNVQPDNFTMQMDSSLRLYLDEFFIGRNLIFNFSAPECGDYCKLNNWVQVTLNFSFPYTNSGKMDFCLEQNTSFVVQESGLEITRFNCSSKEYKVAQHTLVTPVDLKIAGFIYSKVVLCRASFTILVLTGFSNADIEAGVQYVRIWGKFDSNKSEISILRFDERNEFSSDLVVFPESEYLVHVFTRQLNHYRLSLLGENFTIEDCNDMGELPISIDSLDCVLVENTLRLYVLDSEKKLLEYVNDTRFRLRRTISLLEMTENENVVDFEVSAGQMYLMTNLKWLHIYSLPQFDLIRSVYISTKVPEIMWTLNIVQQVDRKMELVAFRSHSSAVIVNLKAYNDSEVVATLHCLHFQFTRPDAGICFTKSDISLLKFQRPMLEIAPDVTATESYSFPLVLSASNEKGSIEMPVITINRSGRGSIIPLVLIVTAGGFFFISIYFCKKVRRVQYRSQSHIELGSFSTSS